MRTIFLLSLILIFPAARAQKVLTIQEAIDSAVKNYPSIRAKANYANSSRATAEQLRREALPNLVVSAQQDYGSINGQNGPLFGLGGFGVASSGAALASQNWNSGFGALYLANVNWDFFTFGKVRKRIRAAESFIDRDEKDRDQELFQQKVKVASAYLNLLAAQRVTRSQQFNLNRADTFRFVVRVRAFNGLIAGVDSSQANAEVSNARTALINAIDQEQERASQLAILMGVPPQSFVLDTLFLAQIPAVFVDTNTVVHPVLDFYRSRIAVSERQADYIRRLKYPSFTMYGIFQSRGSGFGSNYVTDQSDFNHDYFKGINPTRSNYLFGVGVSWNIMSIPRIRSQAAAQDFVSKALKDEYDVVDLQLKAQQGLADSKIVNAMANYQEAPVQVKAASDAYLQRSVLYRNGLTNIVDVTQTLYALNRAETNRDLAYSNVWQALLLKAASLGNFNLFITQIR